METWSRLRMETFSFHYRDKVVWVLCVCVTRVSVIQHTIWILMWKFIHRLLFVMRNNNVDNHQTFKFLLLNKKKLETVISYFFASLHKHLSQQYLIHKVTREQGANVSFWRNKEEKCSFTAFYSEESLTFTNSVLGSDKVNIGRGIFRPFLCFYNLTFIDK